VSGGPAGGHADSVPSRLGVVPWVVGGEWFLDLEPTPEMLHHGAVRASVVAFLVDGVVGIAIDRDPTHWSLTSDLSVRMRAMEAPARLTASGCVLRRGRRTVSCAAEVHPAGTLQGAMVALLAASAAEDLAEARAQRPMLVTELDIRCLEKVDLGPVRTRVTSIGDEPGARCGWS
jgi:acyl-coenzyme A thioesterase PaaI-like protein